MNARQKERMTKLTAVAVDALYSDMNAILANLMANDVITRGMECEVTSHPNKMKQARELHMLIMGRGPRAYEGYHKSLIESGMTYLADRMEDLCERVDLVDNRAASVPRNNSVAVQQMTRTPAQNEEELARNVDFQMNINSPADSEQPTTAAQVASSVQQSGYGHVGLEDEETHEEVLNDPSAAVASAAGDSNQSMADVPEDWDDLDWSDMLVITCDITDPNTIEKLRSRGVYKFPHGEAVIVNNYDFPNLTPDGVDLANREGTNFDCESMYSTLKAMNFNVEVFNNVGSTEMVKKLTGVAKKDGSRRCFICVILSHGARGLVYGTDSKPVQISKLTECVEKLLKDVPKVFIVQACRGEKTKDTDAENDQEQEAGVPENKASDLKSVQPVDRILDEPSAGGDPALNRLRSNQSPRKRIGTDGMVSVSDGPSEKKDSFLAMATIDDYVSWRDEKKGTWFIRAIIVVLKHCAHKDSITSIFTQVTDLVSKLKHPDGYVQCPVIESTLTKELYFFPGITDVQFNELPIPK